MATADDCDRYFFGGLGGSAGGSQAKSCSERWGDSNSPGNDSPVRRTIVSKTVSFIDLYVRSNRLILTLDLLRSRFYWQIRCAVFCPGAFIHTHFGIA